ncbi:ADP-ribosylglycohydrolase family protein [Streptomyces sp. NPDC048192]|jgi:ADP-ribosylglycohydrolase|uniref:ADP-ribosylglycohydrolase family protein n=1 Tax=Streptomyces sp. NPDC048192 TaxID=3365510 RepID=UPI003724A2E5
MYGPWDRDGAAQYRARVRGCLLGGAIGDALGYPVEFDGIDRIRAAHGPHGVTDLVPGPNGEAGLISDDTQMTLFTAEALVEAHAFERKGERHDRRRWGDISDRWPEMTLQAYQRWLHTQSQPGPEAAPLPPGPEGGLVTEPWLYARRAPGNACLSGVAQGHAPGRWLPLEGRPGEVNPDSKGCGAVMRSAPFGLIAEYDHVAFQMAARAAQITHGHPTGYYAAGTLAAIVANLVAGDSMEGAVLRAMRVLCRYPGHEETTAALERAVTEAGDVSVAPPERVEKLGAGWVAEEALAIAVFCALYPGRPETKLLRAVNHSGDSDSTGAICGNLIGAQYGDHALPHEWVQRVEGRPRIAVLADDLGAVRVRGWLFGPA